MAEPVILTTARRHDVPDAEIKRTIANAWTVVPGRGDWDLDMYLGPGPDGIAYEVGVAYDDEGHLIVVHTMPMRSIYQHHLDDFRK